VHLVYFVLGEQRDASEDGDTRMAPAGGLPGASVHPDNRGQCPTISLFWGFIDLVVRL